MVFLMGAPSAAYRKIPVPIRMQNPFRHLLFLPIPINVFQPYRIAFPADFQTNFIAGLPVQTTDIFAVILLPPHHIFCALFS